VTNECDQCPLERHYAVQIAEARGKSFVLKLIDETAHLHQAVTIQGGQASVMHVIFDCVDHSLEAFRFITLPDIAIVGMCNVAIGFVNLSQQPCSFLVLVLVVYSAIPVFQRRIVISLSSVLAF
jgi:hypothetical protein